MWYQKGYRVKHACKSQENLGFCIPKISTSMNKRLLTSPPPQFQRLGAGNEGGECNLLKSSGSITRPLPPAALTPLHVPLHLLVLTLEGQSVSAKIFILPLFLKSYPVWLSVALSPSDRIHLVYFSAVPNMLIEKK